MNPDKISPLVLKAIDSSELDEQINVFIWLDEAFPYHNLLSYGVRQSVPGFLIATALTASQIKKMSHEHWLFRITIGHSRELNDA